MRLVRFEKDGATSYGVLNGEEVARLRGDIFSGCGETDERFAIGEIRLLAPVQPVNIIALGLNYKAHSDETDNVYPSAPLIFIKTTNTVIGPDDTIILPDMAPDEVDYEAELAIVVGKLMKNVPEDDVFDYVLGYTCANDVSARDCQIRLDAQWARGKSFDTFCPLGPWIETEMDPESASIALRLNGRTMQESSTADMIFSCRTLLSYISRCMTLFPGTVILSGTPEGVGFTKKPPVFLRPGDTVEVDIENIGVLRNTVVTE